jgi:hypothetical protein
MFAQDTGPVALWLPEALAGLKPILTVQPYVQSVTLDREWQVQDTAPAAPRVPPGAGDDADVGHLGYIGWPDRPLPFEVAARVAGLTPAELDLSPWITIPCGYGKYLTASSQDASWIRQHYGEPGSLIPYHQDEILVAWTDRWFELKYGLNCWLRAQGLRLFQTCMPGSRFEPVGSRAFSWPALAYAIACRDVVLTDCSAVQVLAAAMGKQVVVVEPEHDRHHEIFWPGQKVAGGTGNTWEPADNALAQRIHPVLGGDGCPTFDARHTYVTLLEALKR